jgi:hypothetical protein
MIKRRSHGSSATPGAPEKDKSVPEGKPPEGEPREGEPPERRDKAPRGDEVRERIGHELRKMFDGVVSESVPEKFRQLIDDLGKKSEEKSEKS